MTRSLARVLVGVLGACALAAVGTGGAVAQTGGGELGSDYVRATASDLGTGTFTGGGLPTRTPSFRSPFSWARQRAPLACVILAGPPSPELAPHIRAIPGPTVITNEVIGPGEPVDVPAGAVAVDDPFLLPRDAVVVGELVYEIGQQPTMVLVVPRCVRPGTPGLGEPPSPAEIWQQTPLPRARIHASPPGSSAWPGVTRLATLLWGDPVLPATAHVSLRGFDVTVVAFPIAYAWDFGDGTTLVAGDPGSATAPVRVTYLRRGDYRVRLYVVWEGHALLTFAGLPVGIHDLGTVTLPERAGYHVAEVRAQLRTVRGR